MVLLLRLLLIVALVVQVQPSAMPELSQLIEITTFITDIALQIKSSGGAMDIMKNLNHYKFEEKILENQQRLVDTISDVSYALNDFEARLDKKLNTMTDTIVTKMVSFVGKDRSLEQVEEIVMRVNEVWDIYVLFFENRKINTDTRNNFLKKVIGFDQDSIRNSLARLGALIDKASPMRIRNSLFATLNKNDAANKLTNCNQGMSDQQQIYRLYSIILITEIRGYIMSSYAYATKSSLKRGKYIEEVDILVNTTQSRIQHYYSSVKAAMEDSSIMIRACDPLNGFEKGESYAEMEGAFQTIIVNQYDTGPNIYTCSGGCESLSALHFAETMKNQCLGRLSNCQTLGDTVEVCHAASNSSRRYEWFSGDGQTMGRAIQCSDRLLERARYDRDGLFRTCEFCSCTCDSGQQQKIPRATISLLPATADISKNMVVTAVKINYKNNVIQLQVREGELKRYGEISTHNERWVPMKTIEYNPHTKKLVGARGQRLVENEDYIFLANNQKTMILDDVTLPEDHVVGGIRFQRRRVEDSHPTWDIILEVLAVPFDFATGELRIAKPPQWINIKDTFERTPVNFVKPDLPLMHTLNVPTMQSNLYVDFQETDLIKDGGQSTIPFWDIQKVVTSPSFPLQGVGLFHKGQEFGLSGGYLALRIHTLDRSYYLP